MDSAEFWIETNKDAAEVEQALAAMEPWRVRVRFSNGVDTANFKTMEPWNEHPLAKLQRIVAHLGEDVFRGARVLDIGFNAGYNAITLAQRYGAQVVGIDNNSLNLRKAQALCDLAGITPKLLLADATTYTDGPFDVVLHLGTLYHLQDPIRAMRTAAENTVAGGHLLLETTGYEGADPLDARLIYGFGGDTTNFWALGSGAIELILKDAGFQSIETIGKFQMAHLKGTGLNRVLVHARR